MMMKELLGNSYLFGANAPFIEALYDRYLEDPNRSSRAGAVTSTSCSASTTARATFRTRRSRSVSSQLASSAARRRRGGRRGRAQLCEKQFAVLQLIARVPLPGRAASPTSIR